MCILPSFYFIFSLFYYCFVRFAHFSFNFSFFAIQLVFEPHLYFLNILIIRIKYNLYFPCTCLTLHFYIIDVMIKLLKTILQIQ